MSPSPSDSELAAANDNGTSSASEADNHIGASEADNHIGAGEADNHIGAGEADNEILRLRALIDEVDATIVATVQQRIALSKQIQAVRMAHGGRRREHSREIKIVNTYADGLGRGGNQLALTLLELCRGRA